MIINNNIMAMNTHRQLSLNNAAGQKSIEKLSSGFRINRAGDDAAGLAISEKMRGQIRGLNQASRNAQDGISMIQTAEGALNETHDILQRMRELATQAANDTNVNVDRTEIQKEMNQLSSEINRIGNTTEFNTQKLLKGASENFEPKVELDLGTTAATVSAVTAGTVTAGTQASLEIGFKEASAGFDTKKLELTFGGQTFTFTLAVADGNENAEKAINVTGNSATLNLCAKASSETADEEIRDLVKSTLEDMISKNASLNAADFSITTSGTDKLVIAATADGAFAKGAGTVSAVADVAALFSVGGTDNALSVANTSIGTSDTYTYAEGNIKFNTAVTGTGQAVIDGLVGKGITIAGKTVEFYNADNGQYDGNADIAVNISSLRTDSAANAQDDLVSAIVAQANGKIDGVALTQDGTNVYQLNITATVGGPEGTYTMQDGAMRETTIADAAFESNFQVGANSGQSMTIEIKDMRALALKVTGAESGAQVEAKNGEKAFYVAVKNVSNGTDNSAVEYALNVSGHKEASAAISVINDAIEAVSAQRSELGAYQNRLEHTIKNLGTSAENLQAAESRVRDLDMAKEMMDFTKNNILQQAATAMLAQANNAPQSVLQLLR